MRGIVVFSPVLLPRARLAIRGVGVGTWEARRLVERAYQALAAMLQAGGGGLDGEAVHGVLWPSPVASPVLFGALAGPGAKVPAAVFGTVADLRALLEDLEQGPVPAQVVPPGGEPALTEAVWAGEEAPLPAVRAALAALGQLPPPPTGLAAILGRLHVQATRELPFPMAWGVPVPLEGDAAFPHPGCVGPLCRTPGGLICPMCGLGILNT
jgi:hypothetical protein